MWGVKLLIFNTFYVYCVGCVEAVGGGFGGGGFRFFAVIFGFL